MSTVAFASFAEKWLAANPEQAAVALFMPSSLRLRASAFGCLVQELEHAALHIEEPQVAMAKLAWWQQELLDTCAGRPRHPLTQVLAAEAGTGTLDPRKWPALAEAALILLDHATPASRELQLIHFSAFYMPVAAAEFALLGRNPANTAANAALWTNAHLLRALGSWQSTSSTLPVPMGLLAKHALTRTELADAGPLRNELLREYLAGIARDLDQALQDDALTMGRRTRAVLDAQLAHAAGRANDPLTYLRQHARPGRWRSLWCAWSQARHLAR